MRPKGSAEQLEYRRRLAAEHLAEGRSLTSVAQMVKASPSSVKRWKDALQQGGMEALKSKPHPGPMPRLNSKKRKQLLRILLRGPVDAGYPNDLWTCARVAEVMERRLGVKYHPDYVGTLLHSLGWTCQKPEQRAREGDPEEIERWRREDWPRIKRGLRAKS
jgi:transposase